MTLAYHKWGILHSKDLCLAYYSCVLVFKLSLQLQTVLKNFKPQNNRPHILKYFDGFNCIMNL